MRNSRLVLFFAVLNPNIKTEFGARQLL